MADNVLLSSESEEYGTPAAYAELARYVLERIDLDPASSSYWNHYTIKAATFYDEKIDGLKQPWFGNVIHNAPSRKATEDEPKIRIRPFWDRLVEHYIRGEVECAIWIGFQLGQLQSLQSAVAHPLQFFNLFPANRIDFLRRMPGNAAPQPAGSPTHANYITMLPTRRSPAAARAMVGRFVERGQDLEVGGAVVRPL
jgi:hypothetical protein